MNRETSPPSSSHLLSDWELWACAKQQVDRHGDIAPEMAALRADELLAGGDIAGHQVWLEILARVRSLTSAQPGETQH